MIKPNMPSFAKLQLLLDGRDMKIADVVKATDIDASMFTRWKDGSYCPKIDKLYLLAKLFGVPLEYFLED